jgi:hypothetical protein
MFTILCAWIMAIMIHIITVLDSGCCYMVRVGCVLSNVSLNLAAWADSWPSCIVSLLAAACAPPGGQGPHGQGERQVPGEPQQGSTGSAVWAGLRL